MFLLLKWTFQWNISWLRFPLPLLLTFLLCPPSHPNSLLLTLISIPLLSLENNRHLRNNNKIKYNNIKQKWNRTIEANEEASRRKGTQEKAEDKEIYRDLLVPSLRKSIIQTKNKQAKNNLEAIICTTNL